MFSKDQLRFGYFFSKEFIEQCEFEASETTVTPVVGAYVDIFEDEQILDVIDRSWGVSPP